MRRLFLFALAISVLCSVVLALRAHWSVIAYERDWTPLESLAKTTAGWRSGFPVRDFVTHETPWARQKRYTWLPGEPHRDRVIVVVDKTANRQTLSVFGRVVDSRAKPPWPSDAQVNAFIRRSLDSWPNAALPNHVCGQVGQRRCKACQQH